MKNISNKTYWRGVVETACGPISVSLSRSTFLWGDWKLLGESGGCGKLLGWLQEERPDAFDVRLLEQIRFKDVWVRGDSGREYPSVEFDNAPVDVPTVVRFRGVRFGRVDHSSDSIFCSGIAEFKADAVEFVEADQEADEPTCVAGK